MDKGVVDDAMDDGEVKALTNAVLEVRKGDNQPYAAYLIAECQDDTELPTTIKTILEAVQTALTPPVPQPANEGQEDQAEGAATAVAEAGAMMESAPAPRESGEG